MLAGSPNQVRGTHAAAAPPLAEVLQASEAAWVQSELPSADVVVLPHHLQLLPHHCTTNGGRRRRTSRHAGRAPSLANMQAHLRDPADDGIAPMVAERPAAVVGRAAPPATDAGRPAPAAAAEDVPGRADGAGSGAVAANVAVSALPSSSSSPAPRCSMGPPPPPGCFSPTRRAGLSAVGSEGRRTSCAGSRVASKAEALRTRAAPVVNGQAVRGKPAATVLAGHEPMLRVALKGGFVPLVRVNGAS